NFLEMCDDGCWICMASKYEFVRTYEVRSVCKQKCFATGWTIILSRFLLSQERLNKEAKHWRMGILNVSHHMKV
ncbi:MAG: hypothetical protein V2A54_12765, partial [Bacteroidota bacterium]